MKEDIIIRDYADCWWNQLGRLPCEIDFAKVNVFRLIAYIEEKKKRKKERWRKVKKFLMFDYERGKDNDRNDL